MRYQMHNTWTVLKWPEPTFIAQLSFLTEEQPVTETQQSYVWRGRPWEHCSEDAEVNQQWWNSMEGGPCGLQNQPTEIRFLHYLESFGEPWDKYAPHPRLLQPLLIFNQQKQQDDKVINL